MTPRPPGEQLSGRIPVRLDELAGLKPPEILHQLAGARVALRRLSRHRLFHDCRQLSRDVRLLLAEREVFTLRNLGQNRRGVAFVGGLSGEEMVERRPQ